jgi:cell division septation protein DedD
VNGSALIKSIFLALASLALLACGGGEARRLPDSGFALEFLENTIPNGMSAGKDVSADVVIRNISKNTWPSRANAKNRNNVNLSYRWKDPKGQVIVADGLRTPLPQDLAPGESVGLKMNIAAPGRPGRYLLNVTLLQEGVAWFDEKGGAALSLPVIVAPPALLTTKEAEPDSSAVSGVRATTNGKADLSKRADALPDGDKRAATKPTKSSIGHGAQGQPAGTKAVGQTTGDSWFVQVGSYPEQKTAERIAKKLSDKGYDTIVVAADIQGKKHYRVRVGRLASRADAEKLQRVLRDRENLPRTIVAR